jgi:beta-galactosidase beta subunit
MKFIQVLSKAIEFFELNDGLLLKSSFREVYEIEGGIHVIFQKYNVKPVKDCFWEIHKENYDINIWISGSEQITLGHTYTQEMIGNEFFQEAKDFWTSRSKQAISSIQEISKKNRIVTIPPYTPHKCVQQLNDQFIVKLTVKINGEIYNQL